MAESGRYFKLQVIAPDRVFLEEEADMIELTTTEGEIGVLKDHIPLTAIVAPGILRIKKDGEVKEAALHEGFLEILPDKVVIQSFSPGLSSLVHKLETMASLLRHAMVNNAL